MNPNTVTSVINMYSVAHVTTVVTHVRKKRKVAKFKNKKKLKAFFSQKSRMILASRSLSNFGLEEKRQMWLKFSIALLRN